MGSGLWISRWCLAAWNCGFGVFGGSLSFDRFGGEAGLGGVDMCYMLQREAGDAETT